MRYTEEERKDIGRQVYNNELTSKEAGEEFGISPSTANRYANLYADERNLPRRRPGRKEGIRFPRGLANEPPADFNDLEDMTKEELIQEVIKARIQEARLKKGYAVKGDGAVIKYDMENTK